MQFIKPNTSIPFIEKRKWFLVGSAALVVVCLALPFVVSPNWGTSFKGGSSIIVHFDGPVTTEELRAAFTARKEFADISVQHYGAQESTSYMIKTGNTTSLSCDKLASVKDGLPAALAKEGVAGATIDAWPKCEGDGVRGDFAVRFAGSKLAEPGAEPTEAQAFDAVSGISAETLQKVVNGLGLDAAVAFEHGTRRFLVKPSGLQSDVTTLLSKAFPDRFDAETGLDEIVTVGADVGEKFRNDGIVSILFALGLILLYIAIRFDMRFAPGAVIALGHDVILTFGFITLARMEVSLETVAALLAIVGYSLNDTIVTFDRIRENVATGSKEPLAVLVNRSINECLSRTILTSLTTLIAIVALVFITTGVIQDFAITLVVGVLVGTYSSIFIASPVMLRLDEFAAKRRERLATQKKLEGAETAT